jgi:ligand-binding SRPBCC domain-containing protein
MTGSAAARQGIVAGSGTRLTLSFRAVPLLPLRIPWDAEITDFIPNEQFCDIQHRGPFAFWKHCHRVRPAAGGEDPAHAADPAAPGTLLHDHVEYEAPLGPLGDLADAIGIRRQLASTFKYRHRRTLEMLARAAGDLKPGAS